MFRKVVSGKRRGRRYTVLPRSCGSYLRVRLRNRWVRVEVSRKLCFERVRKVFFCKVSLIMLACCLVLACVAWLLEMMSPVPRERQTS